jgi:hypothetical protein
MAIRKRVNEVLDDWCGIAPFDQTMSLQALWESTRNNPKRPHSAMDYQPDGVQDLLTRLVKEFKKPGVERIRVSVLKPGHFKPNGAIETVNNLVKAVGNSPNLEPTE